MPTTCNADRKRQDGECERIDGQLSPPFECLQPANGICGERD